MCKRVLTPTCFLLLMNSFVGAQEQSADNLEVLDELDSARDILELAEVEIGRYDLGLVEPLEQLADRLMALNQFDEADDTLDRAVQITRFHDGLHTPAQLSLIRKRIDNFSNRKAWDDARELMDYLFSYYLRIPVALNENLVNDFLILAEQHLRGVTEAPEAEQGFHFYRAHQLNWAMITIARKLYGEKNIALVPLLYRQVQHFYMHRKVHDNVGAQNSGLRRSLRDVSRRDRMIALLKRADIERIYYVEGLALLNEIMNIYAELDPPNLIGQAMSELYLADWHNLFDFADQATEVYERAYSMLIESNISQDQIDSLFSEPRILPVQHFYASIEDAVANMPSSVFNTQASSESAPVPQLSVSEWSAAIPTMRSPLSSTQSPEGDSTFALFAFVLAAENESTFLYEHQYKQSIGTASEGGIVEGFKGMAAGDEEALERLGQLRFRPKMIDGKPAKSEVILRYEIATGNLIEFAER